MFEEMQIEFGKLVRKRREELGLTQEMTAELLEIGASNLRKIECGKGKPRWEDWIKLSGLFSINLDGLQRRYIAPSLFNDIGLDYKPPEDDKQIENE